MKKTLLTIAIIGCFIVAGSKLYSALNNKLPVASPGECVMLTIPLSAGPQEVPVQIVANDEKKSSSDVVALITLDGQKMYIPMTSVSYEEIKSYNPRKVNCNEYF